ncbi:carbohydrate ABC transporter permease [Paenibacillus spongiae]|uniref:Carbohydrate ABC transporter permease n=1 Tax=Paenibacillus spongiae TaxID=2909671 RepID=A0ABY5SHA4_9BACL|nr:carbohydrate ABC transporter permease [Paenibacillus spongiae]UVI33371.1 carbohydrate ABC transporter permease [Paenibacillus spongiae]
MKQTFGEKVFDVCNIIMLSGLGFATLYPLWYVAAIAFHDSTVSSYFDVYFWPGAFTLDNFRVVFVTDALLKGFLITVLRTVLGSLLSVLACGLLAYGLSKKYLIGRTLFLNIIILTMFFSGGLIPFYILLKNLHLLNSFWVLIVPSLLSAWTVILMKTYFSSLPDSVEESAKIDGANDLTIFFRIVVPMSMSLIATMLLFSAVGHWNDWVSGEMFIMNPDLLPVQTILMRMITQTDASSMVQQSMSMEFVNKSPAIESIKMASIVVTTVPILLVYPFLQKYFVQGVMIGSVKG